jgi:hypothetical protein
MHGTVDPAIERSTGVQIPPSALVEEILYETKFLKNFERSNRQALKSKTVRFCELISEPCYDAPG